MIRDSLRKIWHDLFGPKQTIQHTIEPMLVINDERMSEWTVTIGDKIHTITSFDDLFEYFNTHEQRLYTITDTNHNVCYAVDENCYLPGSAANELTKSMGLNSNYCKLVRAPSDYYTSTNFCSFDQAYKLLDNGWPLMCSTGIVDDYLEIGIDFWHKMVDNEDRLSQPLKDYLHAIRNKANNDPDFAELWSELDFVWENQVK